MPLGVLWTAMSFLMVMSYIWIECDVIGRLSGKPGNMMRFYEYPQKKAVWYYIGSLFFLNAVADAFAAWGVIIISLSRPSWFLNGTLFGQICFCSSVGCRLVDTVLIPCLFADVIYNLESKGEARERLKGVVTAEV